MTISGSGQSSPHPGAKQQPTFFTTTPQLAVLQIQGILQFCIDENKASLNTSILETALAKQDFDTYFSFVLDQNNGLTFFCFDELKNYVLKILVPLFSTNKDTSELEGRSHLCEKLKNAAQGWPTQKEYLLQTGQLKRLRKLNFEVKFDDSKEKDLTQKLATLELGHNAVDDLLHPHSGFLVSYKNKAENKKPKNQPSDHNVHSKSRKPKSM